MIGSDVSLAEYLCTHVALFMFLQRRLWSELLADGTRIGDEPGRETGVVSQVVADTLARLPLEGCRGT